MSTDNRLAWLPVSEDILLEADASTLVVTLNRPTRSNALSDVLMRDLRILWAAVRTTSWVRCVVVTGAGRAFCAGADVELLTDDRTDLGATAEEELGFVPGIHLHVPVIAAVNGVCAGGGLHFVSDADIAIASEDARFVDPHVSVGQVSGLEPLELLSKMRRDRVVRMALLGRHEMLDATAALADGLVSQVVPPDRLMPTALDLAAKIATGSPEAVRVTRELIRSYEADLLRAHLDRGWWAVQDHWSHPDSDEGPRAFQEKRAPKWSTDD